MAMFTFKEDNTVTINGKGTGVSIDDVVAVASHYAGAMASATLRSVNTLMLAKGFGPVKVGEKTIAAFEYACGKVRESVSSDSAWYNLKGMVEAVEIVQANNLPVSPFTVKNSLGYLKKVGLIAEDGAKLAKGSGSDSVVKALKDGTGGNAILPIVEKAKAKKPALFPAKAKKGGKQPEKPVIGGTVLTAEKVCANIAHAIVTWDSALAQGVKRADLIRACEDSVKTLANLAGLVVTPIK
jgi:hypothetical protein